MSLPDAPVLNEAIERIQQRMDAMGDGGNRALYSGRAFSFDEGRALSELCAENAIARLAQHKDIEKAIRAACEYALIVGLYAQQFGVPA